MGHILAQLREFVKRITMKFKMVGSNSDEEPATPGDLVPYVPPHKPKPAGFDISDAASRLNQSGEFHHCEQFSIKQGEESWVFKKSLILLGKECEIQIEVTVCYDEDRLTFLMPMYEDGSEGLIGENIDIFNALIHQFNSRIKGGYFTKDTYDDSYALVFMDHFQLSRMDFDWFKSRLDYFVKILGGFRPLFDQAMSTLELNLDKNAGLADPARRYIEERQNELSLLGDIEHNGE